jgi:hypothetical protein
VEQVRQKIENFQKEPGARKINGSEPMLQTDSVSTITPQQASQGTHQLLK